MKFFSNKQHRKILFLISLPQTPTFLPYKQDVDNCITKLRKQKVDVYESINDDLLSKANQYEIVIVVAHREEEIDALVLSDGIMMVDDFVSSLPSDFSGILDFSSCYSATAMGQIKERCPNCMVQTAVRQTTLPLRLIMYPHIVKLLNDNKKRNYRETYLEVLCAAAESVSKESSGNAAKLGKQQSSIYAPSGVKKESPFLIQVFFHQSEENDTIDDDAKRADSESGLKERLFIPRLKKKDKVSVRLGFISPEKELITLEDGVDTKSIVWQGFKTKLSFCATVKEAFTGDSFIGKVMMEVNSVPIGECYFSIVVQDKDTVVPANVHLMPHDFISERNQAKEVLLKKLSSNLSNLQEEFNSTYDESEKNRLKDSIQICMSCIDLINHDIQSAENHVKKVFVSSTSDMKPYRDIVREGIIACNMYPEMYEDWPQSDATPKDECCRRVLSSDILFCILGSRYGYVEPTLGMSMTEIEYRTALEAGKTILVCIVDPLAETDEPDDITNRQLDLIEEIRSTRILKYFSDGDTLSKDAIRNLSRLNEISLI